MFISIFIIALFLSFLFGQFARLQFDGGISLTLLDCTVVSFSLLSFIRILLSRRTKDLYASSLFKPFMLFVTACVLSLLFNITTLNSHELGVASLYLLRLIAYISTAFFIQFFSKQQKEFLMRSLVMSVALTVGIGFLQFFYYPSLRNLYYLEWDDHLYRLFSVYLDPNFAGVIFSCLSLYLLASAIKTVANDRKPGIIFVALTIVSVLAVFLTYSRTGMITLSVGTVVLLAMMEYRKLLAVCLVSFVALLLLTADFKVEGLNPLRTVSTRARVESMRIATAIFQQNPVVGVGFNAYRYAQHRYGFRPDDRWRTSHADAGTDNSFLFVLATTGIIGFVCYSYFWFSYLRTAFVLSRKGKGTLATVVFATGVAVLVSSLFLNTLFYPFILVWIMSLYAIMESKSP